MNETRLRRTAILTLVMVCVFSVGSFWVYFMAQGLGFRLDVIESLAGGAVLACILYGLSSLLEYRSERSQAWKWWLKE